jgi:hypothetical protein
MIAVLQKRRLITSHNITEAGSLFTFKHPEFLFREVDSCVPLSIFFEARIVL